MSDLPLVSCICPTRNRTRFVKSAVACFLAQDYLNKELIVFEEESYSGEVEILSPGQEYRTNIVYRQWPDVIFKSIGAKRNAMCAVASGELIAHWDDDDWHSPKRLSTQVEAMRSSGARLCGLGSLVFYNGERAYHFKTVRKPWLAGGTLMYDLALQIEQPFKEVSNGEDVAFVDEAVRRGVKVSTIEDPSLYVAVLHDANTTSREIDAQWGHFDVEQVRAWMSGLPTRPTKGNADART